jgi:NADPH:quinone reductase-like Zn-dependent oxidoreductase
MTTSVGTGEGSPIFFIARLNQADLELLAELVRAGKVVPAIDRQYPMSEAVAAMSHFAEGHARAKVVVTVAP